VRWYKGAIVTHNGGYYVALTNTLIGGGEAPEENTGIAWGYWKEYEPMMPKAAERENPLNEPQDEPHVEPYNEPPNGEGDSAESPEKKNVLVYVLSAIVLILIAASIVLVLIRPKPTPRA
jgi:hypothetical protein